MNWWVHLVIFISGAVFVIGLAELIEWNRRRRERQNTSQVTGHGSLLKDPELANAFTVSDNAPIWRGILQVIDNAEQTANRGAQEAAGGNNELCAHCASGAQHIRMLRAEFVRLRAEGIKGRPTAGIENR